MNVEDIVKAWLKENGYDGLVNLHGECGCDIDDLNPCCELCHECEAAYLHSDGLWWKEKEVGND